MLMMIFDLVPLALMVTDISRFRDILFLLELKW